MICCGARKIVAFYLKKFIPVYGASLGFIPKFFKAEMRLEALQFNSTSLKSLFLMLGGHHVLKQFFGPAPFSHHC